MSTTVTTNLDINYSYKVNNSTANANFQTPVQLQIEITSAGPAPVISFTNQSSSAAAWNDSLSFAMEIANNSSEPINNLGLKLNFPGSLTLVHNALVNQATRQVYDVINSDGEFVIGTPIAPLSSLSLQFQLNLAPITDNSSYIGSAPSSFTITSSTFPSLQETYPPIAVSEPLIYIPSSAASGNPVSPALSFQNRGTVYSKQFLYKYQPPSGSGINNVLFQYDNASTNMSTFRRFGPFIILFIQPIAPYDAVNNITHTLTAQFF